MNNANGREDGNTGLVAVRNGFTSPRLYIAATSNPGVEYPDVQATAKLAEAKIFRTPADWQAFQERVESANAPLYHGIRKAGYKLAPVRIELGTDADPPPTTSRFVSPPVVEACGD